MGNVDKENLVPQRTGLRLKSDGFAHDLLPGMEKRIVLYRGIDPQRLEGIFQDRTDGFGLFHDSISEPVNSDSVLCQ
jgi:hypothetical protein